MLRSWLEILLTVAVVLLVAGCNTTSHPPVDEVTGVVTWQGKPVEGAEIAFAPVPQTPDVHPARATTDVSGRYRLQTYFSETEDVQGCRPGEYYVTITKIKPPSGPVDPYTNPGALTIEHLIPAQYADIKTSGLKATVEAKAMQFDYVLKDAP